MLEKDLSSAAGRPWACACAASTRWPRRASGVCRGAASTSWTSPSTATSSRAGTAALRRRADRRGAALQPPAQVQLPGHRPARLGHPGGRLPGPGTGPGQPAGLPGFLPPAPGLPRTVRRTHLPRPAAPAPQALSVYARYVRRGGLDINPYRSLAEVAPTTDAWCASNASQHADTKKPRPCRGFSASRSDTHVGQALHDGAERAGEGRVADLEALDGEVDPIDQAAFVEGVLVGQFQFDVLIRSSSSARCSSFSGGCCSSCSRRADSSRSDSLSAWYFPRRTSLRWTSGGRRKVRPCRTD